MQQAELLELIDKGEDSRTQFKKNITNAIQLAQEMVAFSNSKGGFIIVGVDDAGNIRGLDSSGIIRALKDDPNIEFITDISAERFKVILRRPV